MVETLSRNGHANSGPAPHYEEIEKIDAHVHLNSTRPALQDMAMQEGFRLVTINTDIPEFPSTERQREIAYLSRVNRPGTLNFIATFDIEDWGSTDWQDKALSQIRQGVEEGAVAVKIWKNIGMELRDSQGNFVMADHPSFDPVYDWLARNGIPLIAHLGEPKNCWLPLEEMTVTSDRNYFSAHPRYHMYLHREYPTYEEQLRARDRMLAKHPKLRFVAAHLASLEWSIQELAAWLDRHPNCGVDLAERVCHLQHQAAGKHGEVKKFVEAYQDRIIYGSDQIEDGTLDENELTETIRSKWHGEYRFFAGNDLQQAWNVEKPFRGLGLEKRVLQKIFRENALGYYPGLKSG